MYMEFEKIYYRLDRKLEQWMLFSMELGKFLNQYSKDNKTTFNLYLSLPNSLTFAYFLLHGIFDSHMKQKISPSMIAKRFQQLEAGDIIYYLDGIKWKRCSVKEVLKNFSETSPWHLLIANNEGVTDYVPYYKWETHIIIANRKSSRILNARVVNNIEKISGPLTEMYSLEKINKREMINIPSAYIMGNRTEFDKYLTYFCMDYKGTRFYHEDILKDGSKRKFRNIQWIMNGEKDEYILNETEWLLIIGAAKAVSRMNDFENVGKIILDDQFENLSTSEMLREDIEKDIILNKKSIITKEILTHFEKVQLVIPEGVVFFAWK